ncbi:hypothetical protein BCD49_20795 [Pseudofrankia sp. EUN1h]|nr:hypothetical protein BCD49_20795 [Pseudofrankia sp. EUN1h]
MLWVVALIALVIAVGGAVGAGGAVGDAAMDALPGVALLFSVVHGSLWVGWRGVGTYFLISYVVAFALEASSVASGFPFGHYEHFTGGPRLLDIPLVVPSAYFAYGWIAWVLACVIVRGDPHRPAGAERLTTPLVATVILTGWDFTFDAVFATVRSQYRYDDPGGYFGVPVSNFLGWLLTGWIISQVFALVEPRVSAAAPPAGRACRVLPSVVWALPVLPLLGLCLSRPPGEVTVGGRTFVIADIYGSAFVTGLMTLGFTATLALVRATATARATATVRATAAISRR